MASTNHFINDPNPSKTELVDNVEDPDSLKVPSHQIRLGLKCNGWIGLGEYKDRRW
jgi:hypothetical protein